MSLRLAWLAFMLSNLVWADGGTILFHKTAGDFDVTVFSKSEAVRAGSNDLSVMVQRRDNTVVMDATVLLQLKRVEADGQILRLTSIATHAKATNKTLYAATVNIPSTGRWQLDADVTAGGKNGIEPGKSMYWLRSRRCRITGRLWQWFRCWGLRSSSIGSYAGDSAHVRVKNCHGGVASIDRDHTAARMGARAAQKDTLHWRFGAQAVAPHILRQAFALKDVPAG